MDITVQLTKILMDGPITILAVPILAAELIIA